MVTISHLMTFTASLNIQDEVINAIHGTYASLGFNPPPKQFTVLAAFYLAKPAAASKATFKVISISTGTKCTPAIKYSARGELLHDTHAEVLARRGAVRWLMEEMGRMNNSAEYTSDWLSRADSESAKDSDGAPPYQLQSSASLHMYISTLPCTMPFALFSSHWLNPVLSSRRGRVNGLPSVHTRCSDGLDQITVNPPFSKAPTT